MSAFGAARQLEERERHVVARWLDGERLATTRRKLRRALAVNDDGHSSPSSGSAVHAQAQLLHLGELQHDLFGDRGTPE